MTSVASLAPSAMMTSTASMTSAASLTLRFAKMQALCILSGFLDLSHLDSLFLWDWSLKFQFSMIFGTLSFFKRPAFGTCMNYKGQKSNAHCSWTYLQRKINKIIDPSLPQNHLQSHISMWDTLYVRARVWERKILCERVQRKSEKCFERMHAWKLFYFYQFQAIKKWKNCAGAGECANIKNWNAEFCKAIYWKKNSDIEASWYTLWQYGLWSFQTGGTKLERFLPKNQHTQRKLLNFENWIYGGLWSF